MYTKKEIADAVVKFIASDLMGDIDDRHLKFTLCMAKKALHENPDLMDVFLKSPIVATVVKEHDGEYDVDLFVKTLKNLLNEYESYSITVPHIPMFAPESYKIKITAADVDKIMSYLKPMDSVVQ